MLGHGLDKVLDDFIGDERVSEVKLSDIRLYLELV